MFRVLILAFLCTTVAPLRAQPEMEIPTFRLQVRDLQDMLDW